MKKKLALVLAIVMVGGIAFSTQFVKNKGNKEQSTTTDTQKEKKNVEFAVKYAFADIDMDQIIQEIDPKDDDTKADYVFVRFTTGVSNDKKDTSPLNFKNYKLDNKELPKGTQLHIKKDSKDTVVIKLPQGCLKGKNAGHTLELSKEIINVDTKVSGNLKLNMPYSIPNNADNKDDKKDNLNNNTSKDNKEQSKDSNKNTTNPPVKNNDKDKAQSNNSTVPKYTVEVGKGIPFSTTILVKLQTPKVEEYKVSIENLQLKIRENSKKEKVFIGTIKKDLTYDEVLSNIKVEKIKK
ncbi:hypothetical protein BD780_000017 [Clostridium tetanomorphum]|uniref:Membrane-associated protein n=1 Tax=Clostridium tetanomorphum TaxID=1553 RepID=A0A923E8J6_CLOTT|nr:hypothetical protein [Clostridium tetanomorphum]KAJ48786.1 membrane-associated protein [Clostridium tetanomorphum DSM 665]KAJ52043.1 membrane-associated protein [Clostridium tetanomorphum DSM 665]MBC2397054.1 hypothetical protein [Clostridium tetanomorphum]MBP1862963.1 hypothetical protein [Clostridium tetanomorphum]NRS82792.1 hypothetical protein [Clostridium tetanomorphum]